MAATLVSTGVTFPSTSTQTDAATGYGQSMTNVTSSRALGTTYTNSTTKPIFIYVYGNISVRGQLIMTINGNVSTICNGNSAGTIGGAVSALIPIGATYQCYAATNGVSLQLWYELR